jgi:hypothetical protein
MKTAMHKYPCSIKDNLRDFEIKTYLQQLSRKKSFPKLLQIAVYNSGAPNLMKLLLEEDFFKVILQWLDESKYTSMHHEDTAEGDMYHLSVAYRDEQHAVEHYKTSALTAFFVYALIRDMRQGINPDNPDDEELKASFLVKGLPKAS